MVNLAGLAAGSIRKSCGRDPYAITETNYSNFPVGDALIEELNRNSRCLHSYRLQVTLMGDIQSPSADLRFPQNEATRLLNVRTEDSADPARALSVRWVPSCGR